MPGFRRWTKEEDKVVCERLDAGVAVGIVAMEVGRTPFAVRQRWYTLGHSKRKLFTKELMERQKLHTTKE